MKRKTSHAPEGVEIISPKKAGSAKFSPEINSENLLQRAPSIVVNFSMSCSSSRFVQGREAIRPLALVAPEKTQD